MTKEFQETSALDLARALLHLKCYLGTSLTKKERDRICIKVGELTGFYATREIQKNGGYEFFYGTDIFEEPTS